MLRIGGIIWFFMMFVIGTTYFFNESSEIYKIGKLLMPISLGAAGVLFWEKIFTFGKDKY